MSTRNNSGAHYENHQLAAELHDNAAHAHRVAAQHSGQQDHPTGNEQSRQASEHARQPQLDAQQLHEGAHYNFGHKEIAALAFELWQARGCPLGSAETDWFEAAAQLRARK
jgi:hypothetical protein